MADSKTKPPQFYSEAMSRAVTVWLTPTQLEQLKEKAKNLNKGYTVFAREAVVEALSPNNELANACLIHSK